MSGETVASWAVCEPGRGWAPSGSVASRPPRPTPATGSTAPKTASRLAPRVGCCWWWRDAATRFASCWSRRTRRASRSCPSSRLIWSSNTPECISTVSSSSRPRRRQRRRNPRADRPAEPDRPGAAMRRGGRDLADGVRLHRPMGAGPAHLRAPAGVLPSPQTRLRRYEALAGGVPCHHGRGRRRRRRALTRGGRVGKHRQVLRRRDGRPAGAGVRADARWHRCHLGARPAPVSAAGCVVPLHVRHAGGTQPAGVRGGESGSYAAK